MKRVLLLHTGGTLGMRGRRPGALRPGAFFRTLRARVPELASLARLEVELFSNLDSCEMQPELWTRLAATLFERARDFDGIVVTHGTDTLAETAAALSFMLPRPRTPIVLTGAQRPLHELRSDARLNLVDAVTAALEGPAEVTVSFASRLFRGNRVRKISVAEYDAFASPNCPPLGTLGVDVRFERGLVHRGRPALEPGMDARVFVLRLFPGLDPALVLPLLPRLRGLVIEAYGAGTLPVSRELGRSLEPVLAEARRLGVLLLVVSQAVRDGVDLSLYASGAVARRHGVISGGDMTVAAAVTKLMHALASRSRSAQVAYLERSVAGERS